MVYVTKIKKDAEGVQNRERLGVAETLDSLVLKKSENRRRVEILGGQKTRGSNPG